LGAGRRRCRLKAAFRWKNGTVHSSGSGVRRPEIEPLPPFVSFVCFCSVGLLRHKTPFCGGLYPGLHYEPSNQLQNPVDEQFGKEYRKSMMFYNMSKIKRIAY
jgi:hypothetical protein